MVGRRAIGLTLAALITFSVVLSGKTIAQTDNAKGITVTPSFKELVIGPGLVEAQTTVSVHNNTDNDLTASLRLVDFDALEDFGGITFSEEGAPAAKYGLADWMNLPNGSSVELPKGEKVDIPVTIRNDDGLSPGGHYGAVLVTVKGGQNDSSDQVTFTQEIASLLFVKKTGGETYGLELDSFTADGLPGTTPTVTLNFRSTGNVHVVPRGYVEITDPKGRVVAKGIINPESTLALPGKSRQFKVDLQQVAEAKARGTYKLSVYYRHEGTDQFAVKTMEFKRGTPFVLTGIILLVLMVLSGVGYKIYTNKSSKKAK